MSIVITNPPGVARQAKTGFAGSGDLILTGVGGVVAPVATAAAPQPGGQARPRWPAPKLAADRARPTELEG